jgi:SnoaL-like protein
MHAASGVSVTAMDIMQQFMAYAGDFERTLVDDDWTRLQRYFAADAVYEVRAESFGCRLIGPAAIFAGMKKSLDGFDRKFTKRDIEVTSGPEVSGAEMRLGWKVVYTREGLPPFTLRGQSTVRYADGKIAYLADSYDPSVAAELAAWQRETGATLDPSYT